jgi:hypothetical protein
MTAKCLRCGSIDTEEIDAELSIVCERAMLSVYWFGKSVVCLQCGSAAYLVPEAPLAQLRQYTLAQFQ